MYFCMKNAIKSNVRKGKDWERLGRTGKDWEGLGRTGKSWEELGRTGKD